MKGLRASRQTWRRNADCSVGLVNVAVHYCPLRLIVDCCLRVQASPLREVCKSDLVASTGGDEGIGQIISIGCFGSSDDCGGDVCQVEAAEHRVGLFSQLLLDIGSIAVGTTIPELCCCVCQVGDTCLAMLSCWATMLLPKRSGHA